MRTVTARDFRSLLAHLPAEIDRLRGGDPLLPVTVLTRSDLAREETRGALARGGGGVFGVAVRSWGEWVSATADPGPEAHALSEPGFDRLVDQLLLERGPGGPFGDALGTPGLAQAVGRAVRELEEGGFPAEALEDSAGGAPGPVRSALARFLRRLHHERDARSLIDRRREESRAATRLARAAESGARAHPLCLFGFHHLTALQRSVVLAASAGGPVSLLVPGPGGAGEAAAAPLLEWARDRGEPPVAAPDADPPRLTITTAGFREATFTDPGEDVLQLRTWDSENDEVRGIARAIRREVRATGRPYDDFLVLVPADGPSPLRFRRVFGRAGVPIADVAGVPAARTESGRRALVLARALSARRDERRREALDFLPAPPEEEWRTEPVFDDPFTRFTRARDWTEAVTEFRRLYGHRFGGAPSPEVDAALEALTSVYRDHPNRPRDFARVFGAALAGIRHRTGAERGPRGCVLLARTDQARGVSRPVVFHAGLVEGAVRRIPREDPLLPESVRESLNDRFATEGLGLRRREELRVERILLARFAAETATERIVLSWARRERVGAEPRNPSGLLLELVSLRAGQPLEAHSPVFLRIAPPGDDETGDARTHPLDALDLDIALLSGEPLPGEAELSRVLAEDRAARLPEALRASEGRWRPSTLTRYDGVLRDAHAIRAVRSRIAPEQRPSSPTALEAAANCPFSYLVERVLRLEPPEDTAEDFDPRDRGNLFHELLEVIYTRLHRDGVLPLRPELVGGCLRMLDDLVAQERGRILRQPPARRAHRFATLAALRDDVAIVLAMDAHPADGGAVPVRFEFVFGGDGVKTAPAFDLGDGRRLPIRGKADRVDRRTDGKLEIVDYKTGGVRLREGAVSRREKGRTTVHLQLPLYLDAVADALGTPCALASFYHATADHGFRRIPFTAADLEAVRPRLVRLLRHVVADRDRGWFPSLPGEKCCRDSLAGACGPAAAARFLRKAADPDVAQRLAILEEPDRPEPRRSGPRR